MASRLLPALLIAALVLVVLFRVQPAGAAPALQTTDTPAPTNTAAPTPIPTGTPADETTITLDSGNQLVIERRWSFGELGIFLAILAHAAIDGVLRIYELARREGREVQEVHIAP